MISKKAIKKKKKKERKRIGVHRLVIISSVLVAVAAVVLLGFSFFYNASDKGVTSDKTEQGGGKQIIKDVSFSFKTPDVAHWWNSFVDHVNTFTGKTKQEAEDIANRREQKKKEKQENQTDSPMEETVVDEERVSEEPVSEGGLDTQTMESDKEVE